MKNFNGTIYLVVNPNNLKDDFRHFSTLKEAELYILEGGFRDLGSPGNLNRAIVKHEINESLWSEGDWYDADLERGCSERIVSASLGGGWTWVRFDANSKIVCTGQNRKMDKGEKCCDPPDWYKGLNSKGTNESN